MKKYKLITMFSIVLLVFMISNIIIFREKGDTIKEITENKYYMSDHIISKPGEFVRFGYSLRDNKTNKQVGNWIQKYKIDVEKKIIYIISKKSFTDKIEEYYILNYKTDQIDRYASKYEMEDTLKNIFENNLDWLTPNENS